MSKPDYKEFTAMQKKQEMRFNLGSQENPRMGIATIQVFMLGESMDKGIW